MSIWIDVLIEEELPKEIENAIEKIVELSLVYEKFHSPCEVSLSIVKDEAIRDMNQRFRRIDKVTDVLSFPLLHFYEDEVYEKNEMGEVPLGDIVISMDAAKRQAIEYGHSLKREIAFLTAHSMLHLLGYDHMEEEEEKEMFLKQEAILILGGFPRE